MQRIVRGGEIAMNVIGYMISSISVIIAFSSFAYAVKNTIKKETQDESTQMTTVIVKLESIDKGVTRIEGDVKDVKNDVKKHTEDIIRINESLKAAWVQIDSLNNKRKVE